MNQVNLEITGHGFRVPHFRSQEVSWRAVHSTLVVAEPWVVSLVSMSLIRGLAPARHKGTLLFYVSKDREVIGINSFKKYNMH